MTELQKQERQLRAEIEKAFADVSYPGDDNLWEGGPRDDDYDDVIRNLTGKHWKELIPKRKPPSGRSNPLLKDLVFCSAAAWHFFLPAYLTTDLMRAEINTFLFEPQENNMLGFDRLSAAQCAVIVSFLGYASALLESRQEKTPQHSGYFKRRRQELVPIAAYWNTRMIATL